MEHIKKNKSLAILFVAGIATLVVYFWFSKQPAFESFVAWSGRYLWLYVTVLIVFKALAIIWPPIPGGLLTIGSVAVIGWEWAFFSQVVGGLIGGSTAFFLGRKYGYWLLEKFFDEAIIDKIRNVKIYKHREFEAIFFLRVFTTAISEAVSYGAGLIGIHFRTFFLATLCGFVAELPIFFFASTVLRGGNWFITGPLVLVAGFFFYKLQGRYFE